MSVDFFVNSFWEGWEGEKPDSPTLIAKIDSALKEMLYSAGLVKVKASETIEGFVTEGKIYAVRLEKDAYFPDGEECVVSDCGELITLPCFKKEVVI